MADAPHQTQFPSTSWGLIARAGVEDETARAALADLCRRYWYPLYAFARRDGAAAEEAEDLIQGFFAHFLERAVYGKADPTRGQFRSFLLGCFRNYRANNRRSARARKRGGGALGVSFDPAAAEARYR